MIPGIGITGSALKKEMSIIGATFASTNGTTSLNIDVPSGNTTNTKLYLSILYEVSTLNRPTIPGFTIISSGNGAPISIVLNAAGPGATIVLLSGTTTGSTITIPNDATYNGFNACCVGVNNNTSYSDVELVGTTTSDYTRAKTKTSSQITMVMANADMSSITESSWTLDVDYTASYIYSYPTAVQYRGGFVAYIKNTSTTNTLTYYNTGQSGVYYYLFNLS